MHEICNMDEADIRDSVRAYSATATYLDEHDNPCTLELSSEHCTLTNEASSATLTNVVRIWNEPRTLK